MIASSPNQVRALIFDLFGVLVSFDDGLVYDRIAQRCANPEMAAEQMFNLVSAPNLICGRINLQQLHSQLVKDIGLDASIEEFEGMWLASYSEPMPGMRDLLRQLAGQCRLVLLSNVDPYYWPTVEASIPEIHSFHAKVLSFQQGVAKPDSQAFELAIAASGCALERCYFIDDKSENIEAAAAIGLAGHPFKTCSALKSALRRADLHLV
jgi:HAD superfamily hydrolase (TIGR01509 family)